MPNVAASWLFWALVSAVFAAATGLLAKLGVADLPSNVATLIRTLVVVAFAGALVAATGEWRSLADVPGRAWVALVLSGLATGASWLAWFRALSLGEAARVAPIDKLSVVLVAIFGVVFLGERLSGLNWVGVGLIALGAALVAIR
ncbi:MAG: EamA family transporter [Hyphomicrobiales bacterium]|nr:EamA family transporter [Hyphomicrobiales bacterium]